MIFESISHKKTKNITGVFNFLQFSHRSWHIANFHHEHFIMILQLILDHQQENLSASGTMSVCRFPEASLWAARTGEVPFVLVARHWFGKVWHSIELNALEKSTYNHTSKILRYEIQGQILKVMTIEDSHIFSANWFQGLQQKLSCLTDFKMFSPQIWFKIPCIHNETS